MTTVPSADVASVRVYVSDEDFTVRLSYTDAYVMPVSDHAAVDDLDFPRATLVSSYIPQCVTSAPEARVPLPARDKTEKTNTVIAPLTRGLLAWQCPLCGTLDIEKLFWVDASISPPSLSTPAGSSASPTSGVDRRIAKLRERSLKKARLRRRLLAVSPMCAHCHQCPRCGGGGGLAACHTTTGLLAPTHGIPTVGLQTRVDHDLRYTVACGYCQWRCFRSFEEMKGLAQHLLAMSPTQAPVLRSWRRAHREMQDRLTQPSRFFEEGAVRARTESSESRSGVSYSQQAWEHFLRLEREKRQAPAPASARTPESHAARRGGGTDECAGGGVDEDVYAVAVRRAGSTHRAVVLEALRDCCRRVHEATYYHPKTEATTTAMSGMLPHAPDRPSYAAFTPLASIMERIKDRMHTRSRLPYRVEAMSETDVPQHQETGDKEADEVALIGRTQQVQLGLDRETITRPRFTAEVVAACLGPGSGFMGTTTEWQYPNPSPSASPVAASSPARPMTRPGEMWPALPPSLTGKVTRVSAPVPHPTSEASVSWMKTPPPSGEASANRFNALPASLETFLASQAALEAQQHASSITTATTTEQPAGEIAECDGDTARPWLPSLLAYFVKPPDKVPLTALTMEACTQLARHASSEERHADADDPNAQIRVVYLLGISTHTDPRVLRVVQHWSALLATRFNETNTAKEKLAGDDRDDKNTETDEDDNENEGGADSKGPSSAAPALTSESLALTRSARSRRALPLFVPLRRSAVCLLPQLQYLNTTCAFSQSSPVSSPLSSASCDAVSGGRRVQHQLHFHLVNHSTHDMLVQRISLARCGGFPAGSRVGLSTTADIAAHDPRDADDDAEELCPYLIDEVIRDVNGAWSPSGAATSTHDASAAEKSSTLKGWCRLVPAMHASTTSEQGYGGRSRGEEGEAKAAQLRRHAASVFKRVASSSFPPSGDADVAPPLATTAPRLTSLPLVFTVSTPVPTGGALNAFTSATTGPPPCYIGIRVEALVYLPSPVMPESTAATWRSHVRPEDRQKAYGYHRIVFGLSICV